MSICAELKKVSERESEGEREEGMVWRDSSGAALSPRFDKSSAVQCR